MNDQQPEPATDTGTLARQTVEFDAKLKRFLELMEEGPATRFLAGEWGVALWDLRLELKADLEAMRETATQDSNRERARIVSWLREKKWRPLGGDDLEFLLERIEKGEHLK